MKLQLDFTGKRSAKISFVLLGFLVSGVMIWQLPASWLGASLASQGACRVLLQQPTGTIWQGSAALAFSERNLSDGLCREPISVTERFHWKMSCQIWSLSCRTEIDFAALERPQRIEWRLGRVLVEGNQIQLSANILEGLGNPWSTLRPRGQLDARWTDLNLGAKDIKSGSTGVIRIIINNLSSPISPVRPLGAYEIAANLTNSGMNWILSTTSGPLLLRGQGELVNQSGSKDVQFSGEASASPEAQESLIGLLSILGKKEGDVYRLKF